MIKEDDLVTRNFSTFALIRVTLLFKTMSNYDHINQTIPLIRRYVRENQVLYINKAISKANMVISRLKKQYLAEKSKKKLYKTKKALFAAFQKRKENLFS